MWEWLQRRHSQGLPVKQLEEKPELDTYEQRLWVTFWKLRYCVPSNAMGGLNGISYHDIIAWMQVEQPYFCDSDDKAEFIELLFALDKEFLTVHSERTKKDV
jgi:hypothetical protein